MSWRFVPPVATTGVVCCVWMPVAVPAVVVEATTTPAALRTESVNWSVGATRPSTSLRRVTVVGEAQLAKSTVVVGRPAVTACVRPMVFGLPRTMVLPAPTKIVPSLA